MEITDQIPLTLNDIGDGESISPNVLASIPLQLFVNNEPPFSGWKLPDYDLTEQVESILFSMVQAYSYFLFYSVVDRYSDGDFAQGILKKAIHKMGQVDDITANYISATTNIMMNVAPKLSEMANTYTMSMDGKEYPLPKEYFLVYAILTEGEYKIFDAPTGEIKYGQIDEFKGFDHLVTKHFILALESGLPVYSYILDHYSIDFSGVGDSRIEDVSIISDGSGTNEYERQLWDEGSKYTAVDGNKSYVIGTNAPNTWFMYTYENGEGKMFHLQDDKKSIQQVAKDQYGVELDMWQPIKK